MSMLINKAVSSRWSKSRQSSPATSYVDLLGTYPMMTILNIKTFQYFITTDEYLQKKTCCYECSDLL